MDGIKAVWEDLAEKLGRSGFVSIPSPVEKAISATRYDAKPSYKWFFGTLQTKRGAVSVYLSVPDLSFQIPPSVWLPQRPVWLQGWRPHLVQSGLPIGEWVCYSDHEQFQLLPHEPVRALLRVLEDTVVTFNRIADPLTVIEDSQREIALLWTSSSHRIIIDVEPSADNVICQVGVVTHEETTFYLVSAHPDKLASKVGLPGLVPLLHHAIVFPETGEPLYLTSDGPPNTLKDVRDWLHQTSPAMHAKWRTALVSKEQFRKPLRLHFFRTAGQVIGFFIPTSVSLSGISGQRLIKKFVSQTLFGNSPGITRISATRLDNTYLVRRNLPSDVKDLRGLKILLVGCGTIGGYLAWSLVQLGAGIEQGASMGLLVLCDSQILTSQNVGRHFLGMNYLGQNKAVALRTELMVKRPDVMVEDVADTFSSIESRTAEFDIIINASGYESFGRHCSKLLRAQRWINGSRALLHIWIEGRGGVVRALIEDSTKSACFDCMWEYPINQQPRLRHDAYSDPDWNAPSTDGYATMTPFAVSAALAATSLATDTLLGWRGGDPKPRFRSRAMEGTGIKPSFSLDLKPQERCPSCSI